MSSIRPLTSISTFPESEQALQRALDHAMQVDCGELRKLWRNILQRRSSDRPHDRLMQRFEDRLAQSQALVARKQQALPAIHFPPELPISEKRADIAELIQNHQVVILAGETGSGKTTQLPKICLSLGRGVRARIGHTQPRRIAASTVASRIAEELAVPLGGAVGYQVRFSDNTEPGSYIKLMTDGILLAEIQHDPLLQQYDTLIIDEAHERSLNIDFLLGYLKQILPQRPDLKLIITSATIDLERFSQHFDNAPVLEVSGRTYPVEVLYRPRADEQEDQVQSIIDAIEEILALPRAQNGDILVFLSGERDIRETANAIRKAGFAHLSVLPLYARLSLAEQNKVFQSHRGRRVVLATNVAETSITVPGIGYVVDPGFARISRYSVRTKVQRLPIEAVSQASANQRAGRCGRISNGVCIRLYDEQDFVNRPEFTDPEIVRTNLAAVILQMLHLGIGDIRQFPFVDAPEKKLINDGFQLLEELQAVHGKGQLTQLGKQLAGLPLDPRLARMVIEAGRQGCLREVLQIAAALTVQDPRERPADKQQAADEKHRRFWDDHSDFVAYLNLWQYAEQQRQDLSQNQWRKQCGKEFLSFMRLREWRELHHQMRLAVRQLGLKENQEPANYEAVHKALLSGLLSHIGLKNEEQGEWNYLGARNRKFAIFPGSSQFKKRPKWIMTAELLETTKLYGHGIARIEPEWVLTLAGHLIKHHYYEPHYHSKSGQVQGFDRISLFGLVLIDKKRVNYSDIDPVIAREVFIRSALVEGNYSKNARGKGAFFAYNQEQIDALHTLEAKSRRRDILVEDEALYRFYDERIPPQVVNLAGFEHWRKQVEGEQSDILKIPQSVLMQHEARDITEAQFPDTLELDGMELPLSYHFEPGHPDDGVNVGVPVSVLHSIPESRLSWLVPGLLRDKCIALVKGLPKQWRKLFVPVPHHVDLMLARMKPGNRPLLDVLTDELQRQCARPLPADIWEELQIDDFYRMNIQVLDDQQKVIDRDRDLARLRERYRTHVQDSLQKAGENLERDRIEAWDFGSLDASTRLKRGAIQVRAYPALVVEKEGVALRMLDNPVEAGMASRLGVVALLAKRLSHTVKYLQKSLLKNKDIGLSVVKIGTREEAVKDLLNAAIAQVCLSGRDLPRTQQAFESAADAGAGEVVAVANHYEQLLLEILNLIVHIKKQIKGNKNALALALAVGDIQQQVDKLVYPGFLYGTPQEWLEQYPRYLNAILQRLEKAPMNVQKDKLAMSGVNRHWERHESRLAKEGSAAYADNQLWQQYRWMIEELRVSLFAQTLKTKVPVSDKRLDKAWQESMARG